LCAVGNSACACGDVPPRRDAPLGWCDPIRGLSIPI
jgi:hypothetical protein